MRIELNTILIWPMLFALFSSVEMHGEGHNPAEFSVCSSLDLAPPNCILVYHQYEDFGGKYSIFLVDDGGGGMLILSDYESNAGVDPENRNYTKSIRIDSDFKSKLLRRFREALLAANPERIRATTDSTHYYISVKSDDGEVLCAEAIEAIPDSRVMEIRALGQILKKKVERGSK